MTTGATATVTRLLAAIRESGDFPGMARTVESITALTSSEVTSSATLADQILQDYGLTQKVLRLVNTAAYAQHEPVTTITRAVMLMGFERIRSIATGLLVFEHLQKQARTAALVDTLAMSFFSAVLGRNIAENSDAANAEEAFISALFHRLGRLLVAFYLPEDDAVVQSVGHDRQDAKARELLGLSFQQLGKAVADELKLPLKLSEGMVRIAGAESRRSLSPAERLGCLATLANDITDVLASPEDALKKRATIQRLLTSYSTQLTVTGTIDDLVAKTLRDVKGSSTGFVFTVPSSPFLSGVGEWRVATLVAPETGVGSPVEASSAGALLADVTDESGAPAADSPETILAKGLHEITSMLVTDYAVDDVLSVALETIYRALGIGRVRVFFLLMDPAAAAARFRFGFGHKPGDIAQWAEVPIKGAEDLFSLSVSQQKDIVIRDAATPEVAGALPRWFTRRGVPDRFLILLPLVINQRTVGLFYVDGDKAGLPRLTPAVINFVKVLRGQAALAITQKAGRPRVPGR